MRKVLGLCVGALLVVSCVPYTMMDYHREVLDTQARALMDCERGDLEVLDETPEGFRMGRDPQAARYRVLGCEREKVFVCYQMAEANVGSPTAECRPLGQRPPAVHLGPLPL
jgi:hypothetical protein